MKKIICLTIMLLLFITLVACSSGENADNSGTKTLSNSNEESAVETPPAMEAPDNSGTKTPSNTNEESVVETPPAVNAPDNSSSQGKLIGEDKAKEIAILYAQQTSNSIWELKCHLTTEHGVRVYDIEFVSSAYEYDFYINAQTGKVESAVQEKID